jgi:hypothetical protein
MNPVAVEISVPTAVVLFEEAMPVPEDRTLLAELDGTVLTLVRGRDMDAARLRFRAEIAESAGPDQLGAPSSPPVAGRSSFPVVRLV